MLSVVMWGAAAYLFFVIVGWKKLWKNTPALIIVGVVILSVTGFFSSRMSTNAYGVVMDIFFCLMACGKNYKKMLKCVMWSAILMLIFAGIGVKLGYSYNMIKPDNVSPGNSFGIDYPNNWGYIAFLALMIAWYLYMRNRPYFTFPAFWGTAVFMYFVISCRTIAVLTVVFPVAATVVDWIERRTNKEKAQLGIIGWLVVAIPIFAFIFMLTLSMQVEWFHDHLYYTPLHTFAERFAQGGLYFRTYGFPLFGNPYRSNVITYVNINGDFIKVGILDSSFAAYMIMRGMVWLTYTLLWLCFAHWKAVKLKDYAIPFLSSIILVFAMIERPGFEVWYNFILLYPLAKVAGDQVLVGPVSTASETGEVTVEASSLPEVSAETDAMDAVESSPPPDV